MVHCANGAIAITPHTGLDDALFFCVGLYRKVCNGFLTFFEGVNIGCFFRKKGDLMSPYACLCLYDLVDYPGHLFCRLCQPPPFITSVKPAF